MLTSPLLIAHHERLLGQAASALGVEIQTKNHQSDWYFLIAYGSRAAATASDNDSKIII